LTASKKFKFYYFLGCSAVFVSAAAVEVVPSAFFLQQDFSPFAQVSFFSPAQALASPSFLQHSFFAFALSLSSPLVPSPANTLTMLMLIILFSCVFWF